MSETTIAAAASLEAHRVKATRTFQGEAYAADAIRGRLAANWLGLSEIVGHSAALAYVNQILRLHAVPEHRKLELVVSNTAEVREYLTRDMQPSTGKV